MIFEKITEKMKKLLFSALMLSFKDRPSKNVYHTFRNPYWITHNNFTHCSCWKKSVSHINVLGTHFTNSCNFYKKKKYTPWKSFRPHFPDSETDAKITVSKVFPVNLQLFSFFYPKCHFSSCSHNHLNSSRFYTIFP